MLFQPDNYGFSTPAVFRNKEQCVGNGRPHPCQALQRGWGHHRNALRVSLSGSTDCVVSLDKGAAIACATRLAVNPDKLTELAIIWLKEH